MNNGEFVIFYIKDNQLYPVGLSKDEHAMLQITIPAVLGKEIKVLDRPQGQVINLKEDLL
jgi:hypothetical protein